MLLAMLAFSDFARKAMHINANVRNMAHHAAEMQRFSARIQAFQTENHWSRWEGSASQTKGSDMDFSNRCTQAGRTANRIFRGAENVSSNSFNLNAVKL